MSVPSKERPPGAGSAAASSLLRAQQKAILWWLLVAIIGITLVTLVVSAVVLGTAVRFSDPVVWVLAALAAAMLLLQRGHFKSAVLLASAVMLGRLGFRFFDTGVIGEEAYLLAFVIPITLVGMVLGRAALVATTAVTIAVVLGVLYLESTGMPFVNRSASNPGPAGVALVFVFVIVMFAFFLDRFGLSLRDALQRTAEREDDLRAANVRLEAEVRERRRAEAELRHSEARLRLALDASRMGIWTWNTDEAEVRWSDIAKEMSGFERDDVITNEIFFARVHPDDVPAIQSRLARLYETKEATTFEYRLRMPDGSFRWFSGRGSVVTGDSGEITQVLGVMYDITERKHADAEREELLASLEARVQERTKQLTELNRELESFSYSVSHDLRAPLRGIDGFAQALHDDAAAKLDDAERLYLQRIRSGAKRMGELIDALLNLSRLTRARVEAKPVDLADVARDVVTSLRETEPDREVEFVLPESLPARADRPLIHALLENLLGNAWKFTRDRNPAVIELGEHEVDGERVYFVRDNGAGFSMQYADKLFTAFQRLHSQEFAGTGIGLATVARIIHRHGGRVWAESEEDRGATFFFTLPEP